MATWYSATALVVIVVAALWFGLRVARHRRAEPQLAALHESEAPRMRRFAITRGCAILYAALVLGGAMFAAVQSLFARAVSVTMPIASFWPKAWPWVTIQSGPTAQVVGGGMTQANVDVSGLDAATRILLASGELVQGATLATVAIAVAVLCHRLIAGRPFRRALTRAVAAAAITITIGGIVWQFCFQLAGTLAANQVLRVTAWASEPGAVASSIPGFPTDTTGLPSPGFDFRIDFWPIYLGLALLAVAGVFRFGERMQRDTEGLVG